MENDILALANAHIDSYAAAAARGRKDTIPLRDLAAEYAIHYLPSWTAYTLGTTFTSNSREENAETLERTLNLYRKHGIGTDVRKVKSRVVKVSATSAICFITWSLYPPTKGTEDKPDDGSALEFEDVYGFRAKENGPLKGGWEYVVADQEVEAVMRRAPDIFH